ncbi:MAG: hypothetical protein HOO06_05610 [Bdellovibrionaceae bacterium]|jgi:hypothetical protein|nr:hypothetical protein [Pseudobdellovibrionaceae bacterium]
MKFLISAAILLAIANTAQARDLKILSFVRINPATTQDQAHEVCGQVIGQVTVNDRLLVTADPGKYEGFYVTLPTEKGYFCQIIRSLHGRVQVELKSFASTRSVIRTASSGLKR